MAKEGKIHIGTSGWYYKHWIDRFYPKEIQPKELLDYYAINFKTVELNSTFYRLPLERTIVNWEKKVPDNFLFAIKASRTITHYKKLSDTDESLEILLTKLHLLKNKLGPILFQLPPSYKIDLDILETFLEDLPKDIRYTFEFRNKSWYTHDVYDLLSKYNIAFCIFELAHHTTPIIRTSDFVYIRLHGPEKKYQGSYTDDMLDKWATHIHDWSMNGYDVYCYFDNDQNAYAAYNALALNEMIRKLE